MELSDKTKTTFTILRTVSKGGLPNFCWLLVLLYIYIYTFFGTIILFLFFFYNVFAQTSTNVFLNYTNAALMRFATILKVHTIARANMDSREMDVNVTVGG